MQDDKLGSIKSIFRTSPIQGIVLFVVAGICAVLAVLAANDKNLIPIAFVLGGAAVFFIGWGAQLAVHVLEIRERGLRMRFLTHRIDVQFSEITAIGVTRRTVHGTPGSCTGIWLERRGGKPIIFRLESNAEKASEQIAECIATA